MTAKLCVLCLTPIEGGQTTAEHVIPNAIGGRRAVKGFICRACNSEAGSNWEAEVASQFLFFSTAAGIKRQSGDHADLRVVTTGGAEYRIRSDGVLFPTRPRYETTSTAAGIELRITAPTVEVAQEQIKRAAKQFAKFDADAARRQLVVQEHYIDEPLAMTVQFGGELAGRSYVKSALALLSEESEVDIAEACGPAVAYLKDPAGRPPFGFCDYVDPVTNRPSDFLFHCVSVVGQPTRKRILGYVEYFGMARFLMLLSDRYYGGGFQSTYALNPVTGKVVELEVDFERVNERFEDIIQSAGEPQHEMSRAFGTSLRLVLDLNASRAFQRAKTEAIKRALLELGLTGSEDDVPAEKKFALAQGIVKHLQPYIDHIRKNGRLPPELRVSAG